MPAAVAALAWARQRQRLEHDAAWLQQHNDLWEHRQRVKVGPYHAFHMITRETAVTLTDHGCSYRLDDHHAVDLTDTTDGRRDHNVRDLLRTALWRRVATERPKDYEGASDGVDHHYDHIRSQPAGPTLLSAGAWTRQRRHAAAFESAPTPMCARCGVEVETLEHRLWHCTENHGRLTALLGLLFPPMRAKTPHDLPNCLRRCGIVPCCDARDYRDECRMIQEYMRHTMWEATQRDAAAGHDHEDA